MNRPNPILDFMKDPENVKRLQKRLIFQSNPGTREPVPELEGIVPYNQLLEEGPATGHLTDFSKGMLKGTAALPESTYAALSGLAGASIGGYAGWGHLLAGGSLADAEKTVEKVSEFLTYKPKQKAAQLQVEGIMYPFEKVHESSTWWGDKVFEKTGNSTLAASVAAGLEGLSLIILPEGIRYAKGLRGKRSMNKAWKEAKERIGDDSWPATWNDLQKEVKGVESRLKKLVREGKELSPEMSSALQEAVRINEKYKDFTGSSPISTTRPVNEVRLDRGMEPVTPETLQFGRNAGKSYGIDFDTLARELTGKSPEQMANREAVGVFRELKKQARQKSMPAIRSDVNPIIKHMLEGDFHPEQIVYGRDIIRARPEGVLGESPPIQPRGKFPTEGGEPIQVGMGSMEGMIEKAKGGGYGSQRALKNRIKKEGKKLEDYDLVKGEDGWRGVPKKKEDPYVYHSTKTENLSNIIEEGLKTQRDGKTPISFAIDELTAKQFQKGDVLIRVKRDNVPLEDAAYKNTKRSFSDVSPENLEILIDGEWKSVANMKGKKAEGELSVKKGDLISDNNIRYEGEGPGGHYWTDLDNGGTFITKEKGLTEVLERRAEQAKKMEPLEKGGAEGILEQSVKQARDFGMEKEAQRLEKQLDEVKKNNKKVAEEVEAEGGKAKVVEKPKQQGVVKVDPNEIAKKHGVEYVESYEYSFPAGVDELTGKPYKAYTEKVHTWYDPEYKVHFNTNLLREVKQALQDNRRLMRERTGVIGSIDEAQSAVRDIAKRSEDYNDAITMAEDGMMAVDFAYEKGMYDTRASYMEARGMFEELIGYARKRRNAEGLPPRPKYEHKPISSLEKAEAQKIVDEYTRGVEETIEGRSIKDIGKDLYDLMRTDERGSLSWEQKQLNPEQIRIIKSLKRDAQRLKMDFEEFLKQVGLDNKTIAAIQRHAEKIEEAKYKDIKAEVGKGEFLERNQAINPADNTPIAKHTRTRYKGIQIDNPPVSRGERNSLIKAKDLSKKPAGGALDPMIYVFEEMDRGLPAGATKFKDMLWYPYNKAEKALATSWESLKSKIAEQKSGVGMRSRRKIGAYAIAQQKKGVEILKAQGIKEVPKLNKVEMDKYNWLRKQYEDFFQKINHTRVRVGKRPMKKVENYFTFFSTMNMLEKLGKKPNLVFDSAKSIEANMASATATPFRFAKARKRLGLPTVELDAFAVFENYSYQALKHINMSPIVAKVRQLRTNFEVPYINKKGERKVRNFQLKYKKPVLDKALMDWSNSIAGIPTHTLPPLVERAMRTLNQNMTFAVLGGNLRSAFIQPSALVNGVTEIGPKYLYRGLKDMLDPKARDFAMKHSDVLKPRVYDAMVNDAFNAIRSGKIGDIKRWAGHKSLWPLKILDYNTALATWNGAYRLAKDNKMSNRNAYRYADDVVVRTQASGMAGHISPIQRNALGKFASMFQTFVINEWAYLMKDVLGVRDGRMNGVNVKKLTTMLSATTLVSMFYEDALGISSPFPTPIRRFGEALDEGEGPAKATFRGLVEFGERVPLIGGGVRYGSHPMGAGAELMGETFKKFTGDPMQESYFKLTGQWLGAPGTSQIMKSYNASKRGESAYGIIMGSYTKKGKKTKGSDPLGSLGGLGGLGSL